MLQIDLQNEQNFQPVPAERDFQAWVQAALQRVYAELEQTIRIVDEAESQQLNAQFRGIDKPTNVLSFPAEDSPYLAYTQLGDLVLCAPVVQHEAQQQGKAVDAHWAHMVVHGMLHLQGFDHQQEQEAEQMEALEIEILRTLGHTNPYFPQVVKS
jgi:probable rRNA maturation factor